MRKKEIFVQDCLSKGLERALELGDRSEVVIKSDINVTSSGLRREFNLSYEAKIGHHPRFRIGGDLHSIDRDDPKFNEYDPIKETLDYFNRRFSEYGMVIDHYDGERDPLTNLHTKLIGKVRLSKNS